MANEKVTYRPAWSVEIDVEDGDYDAGAERAAEELIAALMRHEVDFDDC